MNSFSPSLGLKPCYMPCALTCELRQLLIMRTYVCKASSEAFDLQIEFFNLFACTFCARPGRFCMRRRGIKNRARKFVDWGMEDMWCYFKGIYCNLFDAFLGGWFGGWVTQLWHHNGLIIFEKLLTDFYIFKKGLGEPRLLARLRNKLKIPDSEPRVRS